MPKRKSKSKQKNLALIDGEILCYHLVTNGTHLREEENDLEEVYHVLDLKSCKEEFEIRYKAILKETNSNNSIIAFGSKENFRKKIDPVYKSHRGKKPLGYWRLVKWVESNYACKSYPKIEADDVLGILATETSSPETVIVSNDKDMKTIPGLLYDWTRPEEGIKNISEQEAAAWWGYQTLIGDTADGYKGCPGVGKVGAEPLFEKFKNSKLKGKRLEKSVFKEVCAFFFEKGLSEKDALVQANLSRILHAKDYDMKIKKPILWDL